jgi:hypothetical protein
MHPPYTQRNYLFAVARFARHFDTSPADLGPEHSRAYLNHLIARKVSSSYSPQGFTGGVKGATGRPSNDRCLRYVQRRCLGSLETVSRAT